MLLCNVFVSDLCKHHLNVARVWNFVLAVLNVLNTEGNSPADSTVSSRTSANQTFPNALSQVWTGCRRSFSNRRHSRLRRSYDLHPPWFLHRETAGKSTVPSATNGTVFRWTDLDLFVNGMDLNDVTANRQRVTYEDPSSDSLQILVLMECWYERIERVSTAFFCSNIRGKKRNRTDCQNWWEVILIKTFDENYFYQSSLFKSVRIAFNLKHKKCISQLGI